MVNTASSEEPHDEGSAIGIRDSIRWACASGGLLICVFTAVMIWRGREGIATVAFVALAGLLALLATSGVIPRRIKSGNHEIELYKQKVHQAAVDNADAAVDKMTREEIEQFIASTLRDAGRGDPTGIKTVTASRAQEAADFERQVFTYLTTASPNITVEQSKHGPVDFVVSNGATKIGIEIKLGFNVTAFERIAIASSQFSAVIIIVKNLDEAALRRGERWLRQIASNARIVICDDDPLTIGWLINRLISPTPLAPHIGMRVVASFNLQT